ncbi:hypothetical protein, partial [Phytoactinopolyspora endophytica]|uniref:hypothetical protein n=1 Tax=Phytoactinopolyspora endophytica TaxID=1642495 RepID=UPI00197B24CF
MALVRLISTGRPLVTSQQSFGVLVAVAAPVLGRRASKRLAADTATELQSLSQLHGAERCDDIRLALNDSSDTHRLASLIDQGRRFTSGRERLDVERRYFASPATPLVTGHSIRHLPTPWRKEIVQAVLKTLPARHTCPPVPPHLAHD